MSRVSTAPARARNLGRRLRTRLMHREPRRAMRVERAVVRDGDHLWVTLDAPAPGSFAAVDAASGERTELSPAVAPGPRTVSLPVDQLPGDDERDFRLVFTTGGGERPVLERHSATRPTIAPATSDGVWRVEVAHHHRGLRLERRRARSGIPVRAFGVTDGRIVAAWDPIPGATLTAVDRAGVSHPVAVSDDGPRSSAAFAPGAGVPTDSVTTLVLHTDDAELPLIRRENDLRRPNPAVLLPEASGEEGTVRFAWSEDGVLQVRGGRG